MARKDYVPKHIDRRRMDDEQMARAKTRQKWFSLTGSGLGLTGLGLLGAGAAVKGKNPQKAAKLSNYATNTAITAGGVGALSGVNFARIQGEESKRQREIKKSNYGSGYSQWDNPDSAGEWETTPTPKKKVDPRWREKSAYTISRKAADPERSREARARAYPALMGAGALGAGAVALNEVSKPKRTVKSAKLDTRLLQSKPLRVGAAGAAAAGLTAGAVYHAKENNRRSYEGEWYPNRERN